MLLVHREKRDNLRAAGHDTGGGLLQIIPRHLVRLSVERESVQRILPLLSGESLVRQARLCHPADKFAEGAQGFPVGRLAENRLAGAVVMPVADGADLHDFPVIVGANPLRKIQVFMLHAAGNARFAEGGLEHGEGQVRQIFVAKRRDDKKHVHGRKARFRVRHVDAFYNVHIVFPFAAIRKFTRNRIVFAPLARSAIAPA